MGVGLGLRGLGIGGPWRGGGAGNGLLPGLLAYFPLSEANGAATEIVGSGSLAASASPPTTGVGKLYGTARAFAKANSQTFRGAYAGLTAMVGPFTIAWWEFPTSYTGIPANYNDVAATGVAGGWEGGWLIRHTHDGSIVLYLDDTTGPGNGFNTHTLQTPTLNAWNFSIWTYDKATGGITYRLNANTELAYTWALGTLKACTNGLPTIGAKANGTQDFYDGRIGPLMVWNRVLSAGQRAALWNDGAGLAYGAFTA